VENTQVTNIVHWPLNCLKNHLQNRPVEVDTAESPGSDMDRVHTGVKGNA
jgi:hypothetical protein